MSAPVLFAIILFSLSLFSRVDGSPPLNDCPPSSCGNLEIRSPFRLAGDHLPPCGSPDYELVCEGNRAAVWNFHSGKFYVLDISYEHRMIHVVDVNLASGRCNLPYQSLPLRSLTYRDPLSPYPYNINIRDFQGWAAFVNCSRTISDTMYKSVACMSASSTHVYLVVGSLMLSSLKPYCHTISFVPLGYEARLALMTSGEDAMLALQMGFRLFWRPPSVARRLCWGRWFAQLFPSFPEGKIFITSPLVAAKDLRTCLKWDKWYVLALAATLFLALQLTIVIKLAGRFVVAPVAIFVLLIRKFQEEHASIDNVEKFLRNQKPLTPVRYTYPEILGITNNFEKTLGQGGFGSVFRGKLPGGYLVAVKMLSDSKCNGEDFISEVSTIGRIHHVNITPLIGFCSEGTRRALVYEYMPNGSLDKYIFPSKGANSVLISWEKLHEIALGIARGIQYLHGGCDMRILHFDIKPHNVLLDHNFAPKVSDFGLAKLYPKDYSLVSLSVARGTIGYIAPELISRSFGVISHKSDVFSFGMLVLEMTGARKGANAMAGGSSEIYFPAWLYDRLCDERGPDQEIVAEIGEVERKLCIVGLWCIQMKPSDRPSMSKVIEMLEESTHALQMPPKPFFSSPRSISAITSCVDTSAERLSIISEV